MFRDIRQVAARSTAACITAFVLACGGQTAQSIDAGPLGIDLSFAPPTDPKAPPSSPTDPTPTDKPCAFEPWFADQDGDGFGSGPGQQLCDPGPGWATASGDCDDTDAGRYPGATEICDGKDNDCNDIVDDRQSPGGKCDSGLPGICAAGTSRCVDGKVACVADVEPGSVAETCDGKDNDCDSEIDEGVAKEYYRDLDGDGFGDPGTGQQACTAPAGYVETDGDCYDNNAQVHPGQTAFFGAHRGDGSFDYDCDGQLLRRWGNVHKCEVGVVSAKLTLGWKNSVPQCGVVDDYTTGKGTWTWLGCNLEWKKLQQECR